MTVIMVRVLAALNISLLNFGLFCSDSGFSGGSSYRSSSSNRKDYEGKDSPRKVDLDGLTPFEKNFYVESPFIAAMTESEVEEYRRQREITVEGREVPKPVKSFHDVGFPGILKQIALIIPLSNLQQKNLV